VFDIHYSAPASPSLLFSFSLFPLSLQSRGEVVFYRGLELARLLIHAGFKPALRSLGVEGVHVYQNVAGEFDSVI